jgi:hypothetical protein
MDLEKVTNHRVNVHLPGLPLAEAGRLLFVVYLEQSDTPELEKVATIPLDLTFAPPPND